MVGISLELFSLLYVPLYQKLYTISVDSIGTSKLVSIKYLASCLGGDGGETIVLWGGMTEKWNSVLCFTSFILVIGFHISHVPIFLQDIT